MNPVEVYFLPLSCNDIELGPWSDLMPSHATVVRLTLFADVILRAADGSVHMLEVASDRCSPISPTEAEFWRRVSADEDGWQLRPLADRCRQSGKVLSPGQCYAFKTLPFLGGSYDFDNVWIAPLHEWLAFTADLHEQTKDLPDGAHVQLKVVE